MKRREFITLLGGAAAAWPLGARAQQPTKLPTIGYLGTASASAWAPWTAAFVQRLHELGWTDGRTVTIQYRWAEGRAERSAELAAELARLKVDVIVTGGNAALAAKQASSVVPIVFALVDDPVSMGLVATLARPGGNVTGFGVDAGDEIFGKRLELLKETLPNLSRVGVLWNPDFAPNRSRLTSMREATRALGLTLVPAEARGLDALEQAFATMVRERAQAFVVFGDPLLFNNRGQIGVVALRNRLPAISTAREYAEAGLLLAYGPNLQDQFRRSAIFVDKIFKGAKPADLRSNNRPSSNWW